MFLSVVIPAYNEERNLKKDVLNDVYGFLSKQKFSWEVLIVDDGSTDKTALYAEDYAKRHKGFRILKEPHRGKGGTVIAGMLKAGGDIVLFTDMDQATPINQLDSLLPMFKEGYSIVIGSRTGREGAPLLRKLMAYGFGLLRTIVLRLPYKDTQCGFKAFKKEASKRIFEKMKVFNDRKVARGAAVTAGFDLEILYIARKLKLKVKEVNVSWHHKDTERINLIKDSWEGFRDLINVRINALAGKYRI
jgi:glycosyltransferase involved in cell wall biosynthesis